MECARIHDYTGSNKIVPLGPGYPLCPLSKIPENGRLRLKLWIYNESADFGQKAGQKHNMWNVIWDCSVTTTFFVFYAQCISIYTIVNYMRLLSTFLLYVPGRHFRHTVSPPIKFVLVSCPGIHWCCDVIVVSTTTTKMKMLKFTSIVSEEEEEKSKIISI